MVQQSHSYDEKAITVLEGVEAVRARPGMYIGSTGPSGLYHLLREIVDNSVDEYLAGYCDQIEVSLLEDGSVRVTDNGRGIPAEIMPQYGKSALEVVTTTLHAGGKFGGKAYRISGGLHGVGISVVNALSESMEVVSRRGGNEYRQEYRRGVPLGPVRTKGSKKTGTIVTFRPDPEIFEVTEYAFEKVASYLKEVAYLNKGAGRRYCRLPCASIKEKERDGKHTDLREASKT
ncbi:MAG: ATP-binding protein [Candidatus Hadarchaeales archaeon]